jgi:hypothetical protein
VWVETKKEANMIQNDVAPTEISGKPLLQFQWNLLDLRRSLATWEDNYSVIVTVNFEEPGKIWMVFQKEEDGGCEGFR